MGTRQSADTLFRQSAMLKRIPRHPQRISTTDIKNHLAAEGFAVTSRTVQRDLEKLSTVFPLTCDTEGRTNYWFWSDVGNNLEIPGMAPATALTFLLARDYLTALFPPATLNLLAPYFERAQQVLQETEFHDWNKKVKAISRGPVLLPAKIDPDVQSVVYQALLQKKRFAADYQARGQKKKRLEINPLGLVLRGGVSYPVCTLWDYDDIRQLALHRMSAAELLDTIARKLPDFDLEHYIGEQGKFSYPLSSKPIKLRALFDEAAAQHLYETPLTINQRLKKQPDGRDLLEAKILDTSELTWWLLGFGDGVEVLSPKSLRNRITKISSGMHRSYSAVR